MVRAVNLARATMRNIKENLFVAFVYNALGVPVAAGVLDPPLGILPSLIIAAAAMSFSSVGARRRNHPDLTCSGRSAVPGPTSGS